MTNTYTSSNTFTNTATNTSTNTFTNTFTNSPTHIATNTQLITLTKTPTRTVTFTPTSVTVIDIVTPSTELPAPLVKKSVKDKKSILKLKLPRIKRGSLNDNKHIAKAQHKYLIQVRKLKRNGVKDKYYRLGLKHLSYHKTNKIEFKNMDKGIYSVRYQVIITKDDKRRCTKWSPRTFVRI